MSKLLLVEEALREELLERERARRRLREEPLRSLTDYNFIKDYRINRTLLNKICEIIIPLLPPQKSSRGVDPIRKILIALNFFARGSYQGSVGKDELAPMAQPTVSKCLEEVLNAFNNENIISNFIRFPQNQGERNLIKRRFYEVYGMPSICGCIDGSHIAIVRPKENEERFFNRKRYHSLNVQMICDDRNFIMNVDARYGGATHDSFIWQNSPIRSHLERITSAGEQAFLLGDSGYPLRKYLMTPVENATENTPEAKFNDVQKKARSTIERTFGILKGRWRCLLAARELHYHPEKAGKIIIACTILHNMCIEEGLEEPEPLSLNELQAEDNLQPSTVRTAASAAVGLQEGRRVRNNLINLLSRN